jgi:phosphohistidine phosphatase SixA
LFGVADFRCFELDHLRTFDSWPDRQMMRTAWPALVLVLIGIAAPLWSETAEPDTSGTVVLLVRHAERAAQPADDPPLTEDGRRRAEALAGIVKDARPAAIITTQLRRTVETAQPSAAAVGMTPEVVPISSTTTQQNAVEVAAAVRKHPGTTVLVVGHGNTVPLIITALGGPKLPDICESVYDKLFVLVLDKEARLIQSRYGAPGPPTTPDCS